MNLRPYQEEACQAVQNEWTQGNKNTLLVMATGLGKTVCFSEVIRRNVLNGCKVLVLAHREELIKQAKEELYKYAGINADVEMGKNKASKEAKVVVASIASLSRDNRLESYSCKHFGAIIIDEAHHSMAKSYLKVLKYFKSANVLGVTATPNRGDQQKLSDIFDSTAYEYDMCDGIKDEWLCPVFTKTIPINIDISNVKLQNGDFSASELGSTLDVYLNNIALEIKKECADRKTVVFLPLVKTAQKLCELLNANGVSATEINGTSTDRAEKLEAFSKGEYKVICNAMLLTEGWNCPDVDCIIILRPTRSDSLYRQMVGRGTRKAPNKKNLLLLDFLWQARKHDVLRPSCLVGTSDDVVYKFNKFAQNTFEETDIFDILETAKEEIRADKEKALQEELKRAALMAEKEKRAIREQEFKLHIGTLLNNYFIADYWPIYYWERKTPTEKQINAIIKFGIDPDDAKSIQTKGLASIILSELFKRQKAKLCTYKQVKFMNKIGVPRPYNVKFADCTKVIEEYKKGKR